MAREPDVAMWPWASERGGQGLPSWILKLLAKKVVFLISRGKKQIYRFCPHPRKNVGKISYWFPPGKNPSDAHGCGCFDDGIWLA